jgi:hypothetical protein
MMSISSKANYTSKEILFVYNSRIDEYDMKSAGFSIIKQNKLLPAETIRQLERLDKQTRNIEIGKLRGKDYALSKGMARGIRSTMEDFIKNNKIDDSSIISIKNDAVFILDTIPSITTVNGINFVKKNSYTSFLNLNRVEFYYSENSSDIKGLGPGIQSRQGPYLLNHIIQLIRTKESSSNSSIIKQCAEFDRKYLNKLLPIQYYEELSSQGGYKISEDGNTTDMFYTLPDEKMKPFIDITYNYLNYILPFKKILVNE